MVWMLSKEDRALIEGIERSPDRLAGILASACLENRLEHLLRAVLEDDDDIKNEMFKGVGALGSFRAKIDLAYLIGMFNPVTRKKLHWIKDVRNVFAHKPEVFSFKTQKIIDICNNFDPMIPPWPNKEPQKLAKLPLEVARDLILNDSGKAGAMIRQLIMQGKDTARNRFIAAVKQCLVTILLLEELAAEQRKVALLKAGDATAVNGYWPWPSRGKSWKPPPPAPRIGSRKRKKRKPPPRSSKA